MIESDAPSSRPALKERLGRDDRRLLTSRKCVVVLGQTPRLLGMICGLLCDLACKPGELEVQIACYRVDTGKTSRLLPVVVDLGHGPIMVALRVACFTAGGV